MSVHPANVVSVNLQYLKPVRILETSHRLPSAQIPYRVTQHPPALDPVLSRSDVKKLKDLHSYLIKGTTELKISSHTAHLLMKDCVELLHFPS